MGEDYLSVQDDNKLYYSEKASAHPLDVRSKYTRVTSSGDYTGHVDLMTYGECLGGYALPKNFSTIEKIEIQVLK